jgi:hypothetical protein
MAGNSEQLVGGKETMRHRLDRAGVAPANVLQTREEREAAPRRHRGQVGTPMAEKPRERPGKSAERPPKAPRKAGFAGDGELMESMEAAIGGLASPAAGREPGPEDPRRSTSKLEAELAQAYQARTSSATRSCRTRLRRWSGSGR